MLLNTNELPPPYGWKIDIKDMTVISHLVGHQRSKLVNNLHKNKTLIN